MRAGYRGPVLLVGHKGADSIAPGNTLESFAAAVESGVDAIEIDLLPLDGRLVIAHDADDAREREPLTLAEALDAFTQSPLDRVHVNFDLKRPGTEEALARGLAEHDLVERSMFSGTFTRSVRALASLSPGLRRGWTVPKARRDWTRTWWARPALPVGITRARRRLPSLVGPRLDELDLTYIWCHHRLISPELIETCADHHVGVIAWTVDDVNEIHRLTDLGVAGICTNDPRLFANAGQRVP